MAAYIVRRLLWVVVLLFVVTLITFIIFTRAARRRPGGAARRPPAVARAGRVDPPAVRPRRAEDRAVLPLHRRHPAVRRRRRLQLRLLLPVQPGGPAADPRPPAGDDLPDRRRRRHLAGGRHPDRHDLRGQDRLAARPRRDGRRARSRSRRPSTSSASSPCTCSPTHREVPAAARAAAPTRTRPTIARQGRVADHAVVRARGRVRGVLRPLPARQPDRHDAGGLHPHRPGQGPVRAAR